MSNRTIGTKRLTKNILLSVFVQIVSLLVSFILNLIIPKFIDEYQYAYWQSYVLYVSYVGIMHFGLLDGIVLRYSRYDYDELDKERIRSQFQLLLAMTTVISLIAVVASALIHQETSRITIILVAIGIITKNLFTYTSYTFQITNRINKYAIITLVQRSFYGIGVVVLLLLGVKSFYWFCLFDLLGDVCGLLLGAALNKGLYFGKALAWKETLREAKINISSGILLLIANWSSMLLIGSAKMIVQWHWGELVFGKVSFAFSVSNLFLTFVTAVSVVLFPTLKRMDQEQLPMLYKNIRNVISPLLFFAMILYFPCCWFLEKWLPAYQPSLVFLGILLPIVIYTSKVSLLTNNYLKAYRQEKAMLYVNVFSILVALLLFALSAFVWESLETLLVCVVFVIMLRSILSEIVVMQTIHIRFYRDFVVEAFMTIGFVITAMGFDLWVGFACYFVLLVLYGLICRKQLTLIAGQMIKKLKGKKA